MGTLKVIYDTILPWSILYFTVHIWIFKRCSELVALSEMDKKYWLIISKEMGRTAEFLALWLEFHSFDMLKFGMYHDALQLSTKDTEHPLPKEKSRVLDITSAWCSHGTATV